jgi:uncharacterized membrane protein
MVRLFGLMALVALCTGCAPAIIAAGAGAAGGYVVGKHYDIKVKSPVEIEKEDK